jgi:hypothetical protein
MPHLFINDLRPPRPLENQYDHPKINVIQGHYDTIGATQLGLDEGMLMKGTRRG